MPSSHEDPMLVVLPEGARAGEALQRFVDHPDVRHYQLPPPWCLDLAGVDLPAFRPDLRTITRENLPDAVAALVTLCDRAALDRLVSHMWVAVEEAVRDHYLRRTTFQTFAAIFRLGRRTVEIGAPPEFVDDRIHEHGFEVQYRLGAEGAASEPLAPAQEGSLVFYPFDPSNQAARTEAGLGEGTGAVLEAFAYAEARGRHREVLERIGAERGWRVIDPP